MKKVLKTLSMMLVIVLVLGMMSITAYAAPNTLTITSDTDGHTYQAYQVFAGDYSAGGVLSNVTWGTGINGTGILAALQASDYGTAAGRTWTGLSAAEAADLMASIPDADFAADLADIISANLGTAAHSDSGASSGTYTYTIENLDDGYFFVTESSLGVSPDNSYTKFMLQVLGDVTVTAKTDKPAIALKVLENNDATYHDSWNDAADYSIGDDVPYRIVSVIPDMTYFDTYYYQITDTISNGSTYNAGSAHVYLLTTTDTMYQVETDTATGAGGIEITTDFILTDTGSGFTVTFADLSAITNITNYDYVVIEYTAELDSDAVIGNNGNPTEVILTYSNNPNDATGAETGVTPEDEVVVFTFELPVAKVDDAATPNALLGATFALFTDPDDAADAVTDPTALTNALYFTGGTGVYRLSDSATAGATQTLASTDPAATYSLSGLDQGTYYLVEIDEPTGYNRLDAAIEVVVASSYNLVPYVDGHVPGYTADQLIGSTVNGGAVVTVVNNQGSILPETGGIGTTIFTAAGILLMIGAAVLFITRRKVAAHKE